MTTQHSDPPIYPKPAKFSSSTQPQCNRNIIQAFARANVAGSCHLGFDLLAKTAWIFGMDLWADFYYIRFIKNSNKSSKHLTEITIKEVLDTKKLALTNIIMHIEYLCSTYVSTINNEFIMNKKMHTIQKLKMYKHSTIHCFCSIGRYTVCFNIVMRIYYF